MTDLDKAKREDLQHIIDYLQYEHNEMFPITFRLLDANKMLPEGFTKHHIHRFIEQFGWEIEYETTTILKLKKK